MGQQLHCWTFCLLSRGGMRRRRMAVLLMGIRLFSRFSPWYAHNTGVSEVVLRHDLPHKQHNILLNWVRTLVFKPHMSTGWVVSCCCEGLDDAIQKHNQSQKGDSENRQIKSMHYLPQRLVAGNFKQDQMSQTLPRTLGCGRINNNRNTFPGLSSLI